MKVNEAPEKIILSADRDTQIIYNEWVLNDYTDNIKIEYTRTDVFIEKARKWFEEHADDYNYTWYNEMKGESGITIECIEDFINYMKGE